MTKKYKLLITLVLLVSTLTMLLIYFVKSQKNTFSDEIITKEADTFNANLGKFLSSVEASVDTYVENLGGEKYSNIDKIVLNNFFTDLIKKEKYFKGAFVSDDKYNFVIFQENTSWVISYDTIMTDTLSVWERMNSKHEVVSEWTDTYSFFHRNKNQQYFIDKLKNTEYVWMSTSNEIVGRQNLITLVFKIKGDGKEILTGFIFSADEISNNFASVLRFDRPLVSIITNGNNIITPIITKDTSSIKQYNLLKNHVEGLVSTWEKSNEKQSNSYSFEALGNIFWTRIGYVPYIIGVDGFALTISDNNLAESERTQEMTYLYISGFLFVITAILFFVFFLKRRRRGVPTDKNDLEQYGNDELIDLIKKGETELVEFKSSLRYDYREDKVNRILENVILKSIAAFANAKGGTLLIGVTDDLRIIGLENDFSTLKKQDADYFELHLRKLINNQYGIAFANEYLSVTFPVIDGMTICVIQIAASATPVFIKVKNKQGQDVEKFYVRSGNASQEITSLKEINEYTNMRFAD